MSNEELAVLIQAGDNGYLPQLWEQVRRFITVMAQRFHRKLQNRRGLEVDDLVQCGYFAVIKAVKGYDPAKGYKLITFLNFTLKTEFCRAASCLNGHIDTLYASISLDAPMPTEDGEFTLLDTLTDCTSEDSYFEIEECEWTKQLHAALDECMANIPKDNAELLRDRYYSGSALKTMASERDISRERVRQKLGKAIQHMRSRDNLERLMPFWQRDIIDESVKYVGKGFFKNHRHSSVEWAAEQILMRTENRRRQLDTVFTARAERELLP